MSRRAVQDSHADIRSMNGAQETTDVEILEHRLDRRLDKGERARVGVSQLRRFLEQLLQRR